MNNWEEIIKKIVEFMGFNDFRVEIRPEERRGLIFIYDSADLVKENLPTLVESINHLTGMIARKHNEQAMFFDVNNYRQERENLISELARAAAKKASSIKEKISLPAMNSYERRIVHVALATRPDVKTESMGEGRERCVVVKPL